ncbi:hypothetical protein HIM_01055 [Hirsutella minnesotensis 3608]|nr:hypothetical protein HIM_01055 [Hirsutella minnesotensis 3608]
MTSPKQLPGDMIIIDSSEGDTSSPPSKRPRSEITTDADTSSSAGASRKSKKPRRSHATTSNSRFQGSEEGEVEESGQDLKASGKTLQSSSGDSSAVKSQAPEQDSQEPGKGRDVSATSTGDALPRVVMPDAPIVWLKDSSAFHLPTFTAKREGSWPARFKEWVQVFHHNNAENSRFITPALVTEAYTHYLDTYSGLKLGKRKSGKLAANQARSTGALAKQLETLCPSSGSANVDDIHLQNNDTPMANGASNPSHADEAKRSSGHEKATSNGERLPAGADQTAQQRKYFPSAAETSNVCLSCAREGHVVADCPHANCKFCGDRGHWDFCCPTKDRCASCRQFGHTKATCPEKLKLTRDEGLACAFCDSADHLEDECTDFWRSFHPDADTIKTVTNLPISCAICGARDHFLSDCRQRAYPPNPTWSLANHSRYVDPNCGRTAIERLESSTGDVVRGPTRKMRGPSAKTANVHYSESDDSDMDFLRNRITKKAKHGGQMRIANNIPSRGAIRPPPPPTFQPPLPPGQPPASSYASQPRLKSQPHSAGASLPAKPPPPSQGYHNVPPPPMEMRNSNSRGGQGNRGGRNGRGRSKGRNRNRGN